MVHNGIEYGLMQAYAEGFDILHKERSRPFPKNAATTRPRRHRRGLAARQRHLVLAARSDRGGAGEDPHSQVLRLRPGFGEGRWTVKAAVEEAVPADVLTAALFARFRSRGGGPLGEKLLSAMRFGFGGHVEPK